MPWKITFNHPLNVSVQPGDMLMKCKTDSLATSGAFHKAGKNVVSSTMTKPIKCGYIYEVSHVGKFIKVNNIPGVIVPSQDHYLFFSKDRRANMSGVIGYFAETKYVNDSKKHAEIFATAVDYVESSS